MKCKMLNMWKPCIGNWTYLVVLVVGSFHITYSKKEMACELYNKNCLIITECTSALDLLKARDVEALRTNFCGFDPRGPKVCCPIDSPIVFNNDTETATSRVKTTTQATPSNIIPQRNDEDSAVLPVIMPENNDVIHTPEGLPNRKICGISGSGSDRIVGGNLAAIDEFPWLVRIKSKKNLNALRATYTCGGSLITDRFVITAAHCVINKILVSVRLGEWDSETERDCSEGFCSDPPVDINITEAIVHPSYNKREFNADISILRLEQLVNYTDFIRPICLPTTKYTAAQDYVAGTTFSTAGWGLTELGTASVIKLKVELETVPIEICEIKMPQIKRMVIENIICAGGRVGKDTCNGDSGGPLTKEITEGFHTNWYLYGVTSFGAQRCGISDIPSVYTRIVSYLDWIIEVVNK